MSADSAMKKLINALMQLGQRSNLQGMRQTLAEIETLERGGSPAERQESAGSKTSATPPNRPWDTD